MHASLTFPLALPLTFALVLTRLAGAFVFVPMPGREAGPGMARIVFAFAAAIALYPRWPHLDVSAITPGILTGWLFSEAALGISIGLLVGFLTEALTVGAQMLGLQAGYGYSAVIDPVTQADSEVLQVLAQLTAGMLFFALGLDRVVLRAFALSFDRYPPGQFLLSQDLAHTTVSLAANIFVVALRLAFPILGLLLMTEIALGLVGRISSQLHMGAHAAPLKMLLTLATFAAVLKVAPELYEAYATQIFGALERGLFG